MNQEKRKRSAEVEAMADELLLLARDTVTVRFRFFDAAIGKLKIDYWKDLGGVGLTGEILHIDPAWLLKEYLNEPGIAVRIYMHVLMHLIFFHPFQYDKMKKEYWDIATDIAVEHVILSMQFPAARMSKDGMQQEKLYQLRKRVPELTAEKIYKEFLVNGISENLKKDYLRLFTVDQHIHWIDRKASDEVLIDEEDWRRITRRIRTEIKAFSKGEKNSEALEKNIGEVMRVKVNYREILEKFMMRQEEMTVNDDEFDYVYYTYGLSLYRNLPLIEPLEYRENRKVKDLVIAIDTSASCQGDTVKKFIQRTYEILKHSESFFRKINIHIIQCDNKIQTDTKITCDADFEDFMKNGKITGFGDTDFRPVFTYVNALQEKGEFENLKGLIYFTDGYGFYPERMPKYDVIFAFLKEDEKRPEVPGWALKVIVDDMEGV